MGAYRDAYQRSIADPEAFFREQAKSLHWFKEPTQVLDWQPEISLEEGLSRTYAWIEKKVQERLEAQGTRLPWTQSVGATV